MVPDWRRGSCLTEDMSKFSEAKQEVKLVLFVLVHEGASQGGRRRIALIFRCQLAAVPFSLTCLSSFSCLATSPLLAVTQGLASLEAFWVEVPSRGAECGGMHCLFLLGFVTTKCCPTWMMIRGLEHFSYGKKPRVVVHPGEKIILWRYLIVSCQYRKGAYKEAEERLFTKEYNDKGMYVSCMNLCILSQPYFPNCCQQSSISSSRRVSVTQNR